MTGMIEEGSVITVVAMDGFKAKKDEPSFVEKWTINGLDLIEQGIYEWASEMLEPDSRILEIGCGTGHSTLILVTMGHKIFAIDKSNECIVAANSIVSADWDCKITEDFTMEDVDVTFMCADIFCNDTIFQLQNLNIDVIILWQPGQLGEPGQIKDSIDLIDRCVAYAKKKQIPIQVLERANNKQEGERILSDIADDNAIRLVKAEFRESYWNQNGVKLPTCTTNCICFALGLFYPY